MYGVRLINADGSTRKWWEGTLMGGSFTLWFGSLEEAIVLANRSNEYQSRVGFYGRPPHYYVPTALPSY